VRPNEITVAVGSEWGDSVRPNEITVAGSALLLCEYHAAPDYGSLCARARVLIVVGDRCCRLSSSSLSSSSHHRLIFFSNLVIALYNVCLCVCVCARICADRKKFIVIGVDKNYYRDDDDDDAAPNLTIDGA
jgi:hypothetical protein